MSGTVSKHDAPLVIDPWVTLLGVDEFGMPALMFLNKDGCNLAAGSEASSKLARVRQDCTWRRH